MTNQITTTQPRVPLGKAITFTDEQLTEIAQITPQDIAAIQVRARRVSPMAWGLLNAQPEEEEV